jgi:hypothetical protein
MEFGMVVLKNNMLLNIGEAYMVVNLLPEGSEERGLPTQSIKLKIFGGHINGE